MKCADVRHHAPSGWRLPQQASVRDNVCAGVLVVTKNLAGGKGVVAVTSANECVLIGVHVVVNVHIAVPCLDMHDIR